MILSQINDPQLANWVIAITIALLAVVFAGFCILLTRILNKVESTLERHDSKIMEHDIEIAVARESSKINNKIVSEIYSKLDWIKTVS